MAEDPSKARARLREEQARIARREEELGKEGFLLLPDRIREELAVLQEQSTPRNDNLEAVLAAEHNLRAYGAKLDDALNLMRQHAGAAERRRAAVRYRARRWTIASVALVVVGGAGLFWYRSASAAKAAECRAGRPCADVGACGAGFDPKAAAMACMPASDEDCRASAACRDLGRCRVVDRACAAANDEDCRATAACQEKGFCSARHGECAVATDQDCRRTPGCTKSGHCTPIDGACRAGSDADCRQSEICRTLGACLEVQSQCVVPPDADAGAAASAVPKNKRK
jgi:hypothetical protein